ncbi:MAG: DUF465 domain-containing protein [Pseudomonadales bacterium]
MTIEHHRDLAHEFPELKQRVHDLKLESAEFRRLYADYEALDNEIYRIEQEIETPSDAYTEDLKRRRAQLKDHLYGLLTGRLHPAPETEEFVIRRKFRVPVDHGEVSRDWRERGYGCATVVLPAGPSLPDEARGRDALLVVTDGRLDIEMHGVDYVLEPGDELFIPRGTSFVVREAGAVRCYLGLD